MKYFAFPARISFILEIFLLLLQPKNIRIMALINREQYTDKVLNFIGKGLIVVLTGQRRVGKSCILKCAMEALKSQDKEANIIYINKEFVEFRNIKSDLDLSAFVAKHICPKRKNYLFIDEVQDIDSFENTLRDLQAREVCDIIITGSNAKMLSSELATYLSGRYVEIHINSLGYNEFLTFHQLSDNDQSLCSYLTYGGLPQLAQIGLDNKELVRNYLSDVYNTVIMKDVVSRESIRNPRFLQDLVYFLADSMGKNISAFSISKYMKSQNITVSSSLVANYMNFLCNAYIVDKVPRYNIHGKYLFDTNEKYYFADTGLRNLLSGFNLLTDIERLLENAVYHKLIQSGYNVTVGQLQKAEIDFVAERAGDRMYIQVCYLLSSQETIDREFGNLHKIDDQYPKIVVSMDPLFADSHQQGVRSLNIRQFLMGTSI